MDTNANQRKRASRPGKAVADGSMGPPPPHAVATSEDKERLEVAALAISPSSDAKQAGNNNNIPASECRRSSRKKIIKFDVRDLLNKNRKPHKIQIEARIDSNAPSTSKAATTLVGDAAGTSASSMTADLSSKQKTFLEKSAIFRRYSISQEPKPPPPPLPLPPSLLGKGNDNKDPGGSGLSNTTRRLSRTQEFFSNVMVKPKQTTSLIVAQMESSAPSAAGKRKSFNKSMEIETKPLQSTETPPLANSAAFQKKRGRAPRTKTQTPEDTAAANVEEVNIKKITPEKAKNWKEYKACLAQQTSSMEQINLPQNTEKTCIKPSEALTADVILEISSSSSSENSHVKDCKEDLPQKQQQKERKQDDGATKFNVIAEIVLEDSSSKDASTENEDTKSINADSLMQKTKETTKEPPKDEDLQKNTNETTEKEKIEINLKGTSKDIEIKAKSPTDFQEQLNEEGPKKVTRSGRQTKLIENLPKEMDSKRKKSPTNLELCLPEEKVKITAQTSHEVTIPKKTIDLNESSKELVIDKSNIDNSEQQKSVAQEAQYSKAESEEQALKSKQTKLEENLPASTKVEYIGRRSRSKVDHSIAKEIDCKSPKELVEKKIEQTKQDDTAEQAKNKNQAKLEETLQKVTKDDEINTEKSSREISRSDNSVLMEIDFKASKEEKDQAKSEVILQKVSKDCQLPAEHVVTRRSRSKKDDIIPKENDLAALSSIKDQKIEIKNQLESLPKDPYSKTVSSDKEIVTQSNLDDSLSKEINTKQSLSDTLSIDTAKVNPITRKSRSKMDVPAQIELVSELSHNLRATKKVQIHPDDSGQKSTNLETTQSTENESKLEDSLRQENLIKQIPINKEEINEKVDVNIREDSENNDKESKATQSNKEEKEIIKLGNKRKLNQKEGALQTEDSLQKDVDLHVIESKTEEIVSTPSQSTTETKTDTTTPANKRKSTKKETLTQKNEIKEDSSEKNVDSEVSQSTKTEEVTGNKRKLTKKKENAQKEDTNKTLPKDTDSEASQSYKDETDSKKTPDNKGEEMKAQAEFDDSSKDEIDAKTTQSPKEDLVTSNKRKLSKKQTSAQKDGKDSLQKDTPSDDYQFKKVEIASQTSHAQEETVATVSGEKKKLTKKKESTQMEDTDSEASQQSKVEEETATKEDSLSTTPTNKRKLAKKKTSAQKDEDKDDSVQKDIDSKKGETNKEEIDLETTQSAEEKAGNKRKLIRKEALSQKVGEDESLKEEIESKTKETPQEEYANTTPGSKRASTKRKTPIQKESEVKTLPKEIDSKEEEKDSKTTQSTKEESVTTSSESKRKLTKKPTSLHKESKDESLQKDIDSEVLQSNEDDNREEVTTTPVSKRKQTQKQNKAQKGEETTSLPKNSDSESSQSITIEKDSKISQTTEKEAATSTPSNKRKVTRKQANTQEEGEDDSFHKDTESEASQSNKDLCSKDSQTKEDTTEVDSVATTSRSTRKQKEEIPPQTEDKSDNSLEKIDETVSTMPGKKIKQNKKEIPSKTEDKANDSLEKVEEAITTTPGNKRKQNKKEIIAQIEDKALDFLDNKEKDDSEFDQTKTKESEEEKLSDSIKITDNTKNVPKKQTPRNKRILNKSQEITQKEGTVISISNTEEDKAKLDERSELKTPEPNNAGTVSENTPDVKAQTKDETSSQEISLFQPSTPTDEKSVNLSRTYSSSESENTSERSSFSSATSSTSTSGRSYRSGDKLKVSIKRVSLPKSPSSSTSSSSSSSSTSSQTSASEEQNSPDISGNDNKKKPPTAKRSKRLLKKSLELLDNSDSRENIDDCFQKIPTDAKQGIVDIKNKNFTTIENLQEIKNVDENIDQENKLIKESCNFTETSPPTSIEKKDDVKRLVTESPQTRSTRSKLIKEAKEDNKSDEAIFSSKEKQQTEEVSNAEEEEIPKISLEQQIEDGNPPQTRNTRSKLTKESKEDDKIGEIVSSGKEKQTEEVLKEETELLKLSSEDEAPTTSKDKTIKDNITLVKRKSLRIRKEGSEEKDQDNKEIVKESKQKEIQQPQEKPTEEENEMKDHEQLVESKVEKPKQKLREQEESLRKPEDKPEQEIIPEKMQESKIEEKNEDKTYIKEQEVTQTQQKLQQKRNIKEKLVTQKKKEQEKKDNDEKDIDDKDEKLLVSTRDKPAKGKKSTKGLPEMSKLSSDNNETIQSPKLTANPDETSTVSSPKRCRSGKEKNLSITLAEANKPSTDVKENEPSKPTSTRRKTGKTSPVGVEELPAKSCTDIADNESSKLTSSKRKTGTTSPVEAEDLPSKPSEDTNESGISTRKKTGKTSPVEAEELSKTLAKPIEETIETVMSTRRKTGKTSPVASEELPKTFPKLIEEKIESVVSPRRRTGKTSPIESEELPQTSAKSDEDILKSVTSTRRKTAKTSPIETKELPKTLSKSSEETVEPEILTKTKASKTNFVESEELPKALAKSDEEIIKPVTSTRRKTGKTSPVEAEDSTKTLAKSSEDSVEESCAKNLKPKVYPKGSPKSPPKTTSEEAVKDDKEYSKTSKKEAVLDKSDAIQLERSKTSSKKAKIETITNIANKELSLAEIKETSLNLEQIDVNEQELNKSLTQKSKAEKDSLTLPLTESKIASAGDSTEQQLPKDISSAKTKVDIERPSSAKRKSLRNQKESTLQSMETAETEKLNVTQDVTKEELILSLNPEQKDDEKEKLEISPKENIEETSKVPKRRGRKPRFKNLHGPETESETESSTGKETPTDETAMTEITSKEKHGEQNLKIDSKTVKTLEANENNLQEPLLTVSMDSKVIKTDKKSKKEDETNLKDEEKSDSVNTAKPTVHSESYLIKNVSIETNTLLDILRTVQSNTAAAALEANKTNVNNKKSENSIEEIPGEIKAPQDNQNFEIKTDDLPSTSQDRSALSLKSLKRLEEDSNTNSPTRSDTASPLTLKKVAISPTRSDSSSPLTLKKVGQSPTRSETSSPLTLKKVTRRYERRSQRGDDSAHKTLEETFAEIAAQSCKAVLAAKSFDSNEEFLGLDMDEAKIGTTIAMELTVDSVNKETVVEQTREPLEDNEKIATDELKISQSEDGSLTENVEVKDKAVETNVSDRDLKTPESSKVTPAKRGRKPKNRPAEVSLPITKDSEQTEIDNEDKNSTKTEETVSKDKDAIKTLEEAFTSKDCIKTIEKLEPTKETDKNQDKSANDDQINKDFSKEITSKSPELPTKSPLKKSSKKRDTSKELPTPAADDNISQEEDIRTPKQTAKKRDSSLTKSETKSAGKKSAKKTKNSEEGSSNQQNVDGTTKTTTPPPQSKRGRKPKNQQEPQQPKSGSKKKNKKDILNESQEEDESVGEKRKEWESSECESLNSSLDKSLDEKIAKKKRQKKLKEAFEAALTDDELNKNKETAIANLSSTSSFGLTLLNTSPPPEKSSSFISDSIRESCITPTEPEEDPDPLKDIEKFIADGVNLLKKDYKLDEDSVDDVLTTTTTIQHETHEQTSLKTPIEDQKPVFNTFETPADTPMATPSTTPPPKSPNSIESTTPDENSGVRRSHRIKLITQTPKALVGRGLVRDKERFSIKDDVETKSHYTLDDHLTDLAEVEAKNAKFLKEMEERLSNFQVIKENDYLCERVISREARKMICDCFLTHEEEERGELGCGEDCLNRLLMIECGPECNVKERCTNKRFQKTLCSPCRVFRTEKKGFGIMADIEILPGEFIMEYVGEVIDTEIFEQRRIMYSQDKNRHYYFMALRSDAIIDATVKGNISRFINHSCDPNAETQKWTVNGELRIGFFSRKSIMPGEEITFNYQYQRYGREAQRCYCESSNCRGWIGPEPTSDEGEQIDDEDYEDEDESEDELEEEEAQVTSTLLQHEDDDEDSDASVVDPEEVQKKLEMAAAQAEVELAPIEILEEKDKEEVSVVAENKATDDDSVKPENEEEDSKSKFKKLLSIMAEKVAAKQKQTKREQKLQRKKKSKESSSELANKLRFLEDPDIEDEVEFLRECGLKNQSDTLRLSRLMVRAKLVQTRLNLLDILRKGDLPCRRLFLDYHGLRLVHGWMSEDAGNMQIRLALLQTLNTLPIANKTVLTDSKVMQMVRNWCGSQTALSPNEDSSSSNSNSQDAALAANANNAEEPSSDLQELQKLALNLMTTWDGLPEIFRIPKKERIEQMKEHEREADRQYAANAETEENKNLTDRYRRDRFGRGFSSSGTSNTFNRFHKPNNGNPLRATTSSTSTTADKNNKNISKAQRREMFAAKVARAEAEKRMAEERREFETKCRFFGLDPKKTRPQDVPFCVNPASGQWYSIERKPISTPPSYAHVQVPVKPKSTDPNDYQLPAVCSNLPAQWKYAITPQGKIYYYHYKYRVPQWEPPTLAQLQQCELEAEEGDSESEHATTAGENSSEDDDEILIGMDAVQLRAYIDRKVESRRQKRYQRLVDQRAISPRREEDRIYNQIEVRKYKENKEKIRKRKEEIRRKRAEALRQTSLNMCTLGSLTESNLNAIKIQTESDEELGVLPIQDYLLSSDDEIVDIKAEVNSPLIDKIVEGDKIVDELDALTSKRPLKRPLPPHRDLSEASTSSSASTSAIIMATIDRQEYKKRKLEKKEKRKPKDQDAKYRKHKEKFRCEIAGIIVHHLKPYRRDTCTIGRIQSNEDFNHLARKLTHFVMIKELKYCDSVGQTLVVTESVKNKSREFIKKYMAKYGDVYVKPSNDPDFKDIPFTL